MNGFDLKNYHIFFWDFDGVIKRSNQIKVDAFKQLFKDSDCVDKIIEHHIQNQGISRYEKIPLYLMISGRDTSKPNVAKYIQEFSDIVVDKVVHSDWIPGVLQFLEKTSAKVNIIVTGTPQNEIEMILQQLKLDKQFDYIYGAPHNKTDSIKNIISSNDICIKKMIMIGDSMEDFNAAVKNQIDFMLIENEYNSFIDRKKCMICASDFLDL
ncbi:MAG: HAD family hydrolase [SAR86 cluster bacterium]|nr:HAD family hydrolase [SAR86 cluster bacterium]